MTTTASQGGSRSDRRDDIEWVRQLQAGQADAFELLVRTFGGRLLTVARRYLGNEADAEDAVQTAFLNAFRSIHQFRNECQLATWLHRIVVNAALMALRARQRRPEESIEFLLPAFQADGHHVEQFAAWGEPIDRLMEQDETRAMVRACIEQLPPSHRIVLLLRDSEDVSTQEAAEMLMMTPTAVKVRLHRARQALASLLRKQFAHATETAQPVQIPRTGQAHELPRSDPGRTAGERPTAHRSRRGHKVAAGAQAVAVEALVLDEHLTVSAKAQAHHRRHTRSARRKQRNH